MNDCLSRRANISSAVAALICIGILAACSEAPKESPPVFALPVSQVIGAPNIEGQEPAVSTAQSNTRQLRYIAVPPGQKVAGMARAHLILKPTHRHHAHAHKIARHERVRGETTAKRQAKTNATPAVENAPAATMTH